MMSDRIAHANRRGVTVSKVGDLISLSGPDNVGKSTQLRMLERRASGRAVAAGALANQDVRWWRPEVGSADWWFAHGPIEEVAGLLATSYIRRHRAARSFRGCT